MKHVTYKRHLSLALSLLMILTLSSVASCGKKDTEADTDAEETEAVEKETLNSEQNSFADALGGVSETFTGAISEESYDSSEDAATAFVNEELAGNQRAEIQSVQTRTLSSENIAGLDIPEDILKGSDAVEEVEVKYAVEDSDSLESRNGFDNLASLNKTKTVKVYVIRYGTDWKYFSPMPVTGNTISKSYYNSVFNADKYKNCTLVMNSDVVAEISAEGETMEMIIRTSQTIKHADGKVYLEQSVYTNQFEADVTEQTVYAYMETDEDGNIRCYVSLDPNGDWFATSLTAIGFQSLDQLTPFHDQYLDYTYFTKTSYGFALEEENARAYFTQALSDALSSLQELLDPDKMDLDMYAEYYVSEGVLSGMRVDASVDMTITEGGASGKLTETITSVVSCTDYGTTVVEKPFTE